MSSYNGYSGGQYQFQLPPSALKAAASTPEFQAVDENTEESLNLMAWGTAQAIAMAKLKVFHSMAKSVNDQQ